MDDLEKMLAELDGSPIAQQALSLYMKALDDPAQAALLVKVADGLVKLLGSKRNLHEGGNRDADKESAVLTAIIGNDA